MLQRWGEGGEVVRDEKPVKRYQLVTVTVILRSAPSALAPCHLGTCNIESWGDVSERENIESSFQLFTVVIKSVALFKNSDYAFRAGGAFPPRWILISRP